MSDDEPAKRCCTFFWFDAEGRPQESHSPPPFDGYRRCAREAGHAGGHRIDVLVQ